MARSILSQDHTLAHAHAHACARTHTYTHIFSLSFCHTLPNNLFLVCHAISLVQQKAVMEQVAYKYKHNLADNKVDLFSNIPANSKKQQHPYQELVNKTAKVINMSEKIWRKLHHLKKYINNIKIKRARTHQHIICVICGNKCMPLFSII